MEIVRDQKMLDFVSPFPVRLTVPPPSLRLFTLTEKIKSAEGVKRHVHDEQLNDSRHSLDADDNEIALTRRDSRESITSDDIWTGKSRITTLKAADPEVSLHFLIRILGPHETKERLLWVNTIRRSMEICQSIVN
jgi:hypothetical protein